MFYQIAIRAVNLLWHFWFKLQIFGRENEPKEGGYILASNHCSAIDPMIVCQGIRRVPIHYMAKAELFENKLFGAVLRGLGAFPVKRGAADIGAIKEALKILNSGGRLLVFPEGTRNSTDGAKAGAGMLALRSDCDVVPVYVSPGRKLFHRVYIVFGQPYRPALPDAKPVSEDYHRAADEILRRVYTLENNR